MYEGLSFKEILSEHLQFVRGSEGMVVNGREITATPLSLPQSNDQAENATHKHKEKTATRAVFSLWSKLSK